jgi:hypothetical protein
MNLIDYLEDKNPELLSVVKCGLGNNFTLFIKEVENYIGDKIMDAKEKEPGISTMVTTLYDCQKDMEIMRERIEFLETQNFN